MTMTCAGCGQRSDWIGEESNWHSIEDDGGQAVTLGMYVCENCGNRQRIG